jgi:hypothetical protein
MGPAFCVRGRRGTHLFGCLERLCVYEPSQHYVIGARKINRQLFWRQRNEPAQLFSVIVNVEAHR